MQRLSARIQSRKELFGDMKKLFCGGTVVSGSAVKKADILTDGEKILQVGENLSAENAEKIDVTGKLLFPGFIDAHTHFNLAVAGTVTADDFETGSRSALAGGTTTVIDFASQDKGDTQVNGLKRWHAFADGKTWCDYSFHMSIVEWNEQSKKEIRTMIKEGITSFKLYMTYPAMMVGDGAIYEILKELKKYGCFAGVHCENAEVIDAKIREAKAAGDNTPATHRRVRPDTMEAEAVHRLLVIAGEADAPVMVVHTTCEKSFREIEEARARGQIVYSETCPHYLLLDDSCYEGPFEEGSKYICAPPIRKKCDQEVLWKALSEDRIQTVSTDHCSFTTKQKALGKDDFTKIPGGINGVETRGVLLYTYGVGAGRITMEQMCRVLSENPAKLYGLYPQKGILKAGSDADIVVLDPEKEDVISAATQHCNVDYAPFEGFKIKGTIDSVYLRGNKVYEDGMILGSCSGKFLKRGKNSL